MGASYEKVIFSHSIANYRFHFIPPSACCNWFCGYGSGQAQASASERRAFHGGSETAGEGAGEARSAGGVAGTRAGGSCAAGGRRAGGSRAGGSRAGSGGAGAESGGG